MFCSQSVRLFRCEINFPHSPASFTIQIIGTSGLSRFYRPPPNRKIVIYSTYLFLKEIWRDKQSVYFRDLQGRLTDIARDRIRAGILTERGLARMCGLSQPHVHNVLKGVRTFSTDSADRLMQALGLVASDLLFRVSAETDTRLQAIPVVRNRIGPGTDADFAATRGFIALPETLVKGLVNPVAGRLAPDLVLPRALAAHDLVLLDQNAQLRAAPSCHSLWIVSDGAGLRVRYVQLDRGNIHLANEVTLPDPQKWRSIPLHGRNILDVVKARVVWISREMGPAADQL